MASSLCSLPANAALTNKRTSSPWRIGNSTSKADYCAVVTAPTILRRPFRIQTIKIYQNEQISQLLAWGTRSSKGKLTSDTFYSTFYKTLHLCIRFRAVLALQTRKYSYSMEYTTYIIQRYTFLNLIHQEALAENPLRPQS